MSQPGGEQPFPDLKGDLRSPLRPSLLRGGGGHVCLGLLPSSDVSPLAPHLRPLALLRSTDLPFHCCPQPLLPSMLLSHALCDISLILQRSVQPPGPQQGSSSLSNRHGCSSLACPAHAPTSPHHSGMRLETSKAGSGCSTFFWLPIAPGTQLKNICF